MTLEVNNVQQTGQEVCGNCKHASSVELLSGDRVCNKKDVFVSSFGSCPHFEKRKEKDAGGEKL